MCISGEHQGRHSGRLIITTMLIHSVVIPALIAVVGVASLVVSDTDFEAERRLRILAGGNEGAALDGIAFRQGSGAGAHLSDGVGDRWVIDVIEAG